MIAATDCGNMTEIIKPLIVGVVGAYTLRMFRSPRPKPDLPWHSVDDLQACLDLPRQVRRQLQRSMIDKWQADIMTITTDDGITIIGPHLMAQGIIRAAVKMGCSTPKFEDEYVKLGIVAMRTLTGVLSSEMQYRFLLAAYEGQGDRS